MEDSPTSAAPAPGQQPDPNRAHQMFPKLPGADVERVRRFGEPHHAADGSYLIQAGQKSRGLFRLIKGRVTVTQRDGLGRIRPRRVAVSRRRKLWLTARAMVLW